ncbi:type I-E CRISPR-associated protein Cas6/Cse3/CasE [Jonesia quinghaiensis]|uniref:type I-E CRISPR-associated protein Cas6/Cse3/CasE n=1 Tax=Jonesia quinghaiensis TaxID=262806 RepID=UPI0003F6B06B|nr:type I-E CRISPR-associated protein Cas6/Cse3/CasE [Jonesia quinghaiensis]
MFISRMSLNPSRRETRRLLGNPQIMHATVMASFPPAAHDVAGDQRILWRVDTSPTRHDLLIVSPTPPDLTGMVETAGWPTAETWQTREYNQRLNTLKTGQQWAFRLMANPTHTIASGNGKRGKRVAHVTPTHQLAWLEHKAEAHGFTLHPLTSATQPGETNPLEASALITKVTDWRFARQRKTVTLKAVQFDGALEITDPDTFKQTLTNGIGSAKAYGCGLITIAPLKN